MSIKKVKSPAKIFISDLGKLENIVVKAMDRIDQIVGSSLGPGGRPSLIESDLHGIPHKNTKDGVTIFRALGSSDPYEHLIIEQTRDAAIKTVNEAGDGPVPLYSKVLTPKGFIEMRDVKVGMEICGTDGTLQKVMGVYPKGQKEIYEIEIANKGIIECCADHLWEVTTNYGTKEVKTVKSLLLDYVETQKNGNNKYKYYTPRTHVDFYENKSEMPLDPYLVGVLIGDGSLKESGSIEISLGLKKKHIIEKLNIPNGINMSVQLVENKNYYRVKFNGTDINGRSLRQHIVSLGLDVGSASKFIPKSYLYSSKTTREALLQGLLDTDGHINTRGLFEFTTISNELAKDFIELVNSLGKSIYSRVHNRDKDSDSYSDTPIHRIYELKGYKYGNKITRITPTGKFTEMQCIKVSNPNSLYVMDNYIVTHNTTTSTILAAAFIKNLFHFCADNRKYSPQKVTREIDKIVKNKLIPQIKKSAIKITPKNMDLLLKVATVSANGDSEMANAVIEAFEKVGYGSSSHVTIQELSGASRYEVELIEGFPIEKGYEESIGKFHPAFINDQGHQRCILEKPLFVLFDGNITDIVQVQDILSNIGEEYVSGKSDFKNVVIVAHKFNDQVLTNFAFNFSNPNTINVVPLATPMSPIVNGQLHFLMDLSAFTGAKIFDMNNPLSDAAPDDFGKNMEKIEIYRFRTTIVGESDPTNIEVRAEEIKTYINQCESKIEKNILEERLGKLTNGIARLKIYGSSNGELKEKADRAEDAVCAVRASINHGCLPGGCRTLIDLALMLQEDQSPVVQQVIIPSLFTPFYRLLQNAGYTPDEISDILSKMIESPNKVYDVENAEFGDFKKMGIFDAAMAVEQALSNSTSIASVMGSLGGLIAYPRDNALENQEYKEQMDFQRTLDNAKTLAEEANERY